jgi:hypothetical protein
MIGVSRSGVAYSSDYFPQTPSSTYLVPLRHPLLYEERSTCGCIRALLCDESFQEGDHPHLISSITGFLQHVAGDSRPSRRGSAPVTDGSACDGGGRTDGAEAEIT